MLRWLMRLFGYECCPACAIWAPEGEPMVDHFDTHL